MNQIERLKVRLRVMQFMGNFEEDMNIIVPVSFRDLSSYRGRGSRGGEGGGGGGEGGEGEILHIFYMYFISSASGCCHSCIKISHFFTVLQKSA